MAEDKFLIAPIKEGMRGDTKAWQIPEDSFERLENAYVYEGKVVKRFGSKYTGTGAAAGFESLRSRLRIPLLGGSGVGTTDANGDATGTVPGGGYAQAGQAFVIGDDTYTVQATGAPVTMLQNGGTATVLTYNTTTGVYAFEDADPNEQVYFYPSAPVMGLFNYETGNIHERPAIAADTRLIYQFDGVHWNAIGPIAAGVHVPFTGSDSQFFNITNWMGTQFYNTYLFVTNNVAADGMWYWDGTTWTAWAPKFLVAGAANRNVINTCRLIVPFKDRLWLLGTTETDAAGAAHVYQNRARDSHNGSPLAASAWYEPNEVGYTGGGWIESSTEEEIISSEFIKDRLIVFYERSTWELAYTGNQIQPAVWQKINTELGSESPQSSVPFDKAILTVGTTGIHACNGSNVVRVDDSIPDEVFRMRNENAGPFRVGGIRDYIVELVYWTIPYIIDNAFSKTFPNKVLVFNYNENTWALNDDSITSFGYFEQQTGAMCQLGGVIDPQPVQVIAGNQQGFVFLLDTGTGSSCTNVNASVLQISNITSIQPVVTLTIINHNLLDDDVIKIEYCQGTVELNDNHYEVTVVDSDTITIVFDDTITAYEGLGCAARVSRIDILTKQFNPYIDEGMNVSVDRIEFAVDKTSNGFLNVESFTSSAESEPASVTGVDLGASILETTPYLLNPMEATQTLLWHPVYFQSSGSFIQVRLYASTDDVLLVPAVADESFILEGMLLHTSPKGRLD